MCYYFFHPPPRYASYGIMPTFISFPSSSVAVEARRQSKCILTLHGGGGGRVEEKLSHGGGLKGNLISGTMDINESVSTTSRKIRTP